MTPAVRASFNGATAVTPWKTDRSHRSTDDRGRLQWGHGGDAVEDRSRDLDGSRPWSLQWGHGGDAVEDGDASDAGPSAQGFNGATAVTPWKSRLQPSR